MQVDIPDLKHSLSIRVPVDAPVSDAGGMIRAGSSPAPNTMLEWRNRQTHTP